MKRLWLYFPENDLALAAGVASYTPPPAAGALHRAGEALPLWMASPGDRLLCSGLNEKWFVSTCHRFSIENVDVYDHRAQDLEPTPWGWSEASRRVFVDAGFPPSRLPDSVALGRMRMLSHRCTAARVASRLQEVLPFRIAPPACMASDEAAVAAYLDREGRVIAKSPWSSTGRGLVRSRSMPREAFLQQTRGIIRRQGSVMLECEYDRMLDFAMLFETDGGGTVKFKGLSLFTTSERGAYSGNVVSSQETICSRIAAEVGPERVDTIRGALEQVLPEVLGDYAGPLGVDMLLDDTGMIDACVEVNLRYTMGFVALALGLRMASGVEAVLQVVPQPQRAASGAVLDSQGLICGGELDLTPPDRNFSFRLTARQ